MNDENDEDTPLDVTGWTPLPVRDRQQSATVYPSRFAQPDELGFGDAAAPAPKAASGTDDPLVGRPRVSSIVVCAVLGVAFVAVAMLVWWASVRTLGGQQYDNMAFADMAADLPAWLSAPASLLAFHFGAGGISVLVVPDAVFAIGAVAMTVVRKRWRLLAQLLVFAAVAIAAAETLKRLLPREMMDRSTLEVQGNTSPSGHVAVAMVCMVALACAVPRMARALVAAVGAAYMMIVGLSVVVGGYHRPCDALVAMMLVGGLALLMLAATGGSGMDEPGTRMSSASVQIVGTVLITGGLLACGYAGYVIWQLSPGLEYSAAWARPAAHASAAVMAGGVSALLFGLILALRHITASPLSRLGLLGTPPAPPRR